MEWNHYMDTYLFTDYVHTIIFAILCYIWLFSAAVLYTAHLYAMIHTDSFERTKANII